MADVEICSVGEEVDGQRVEARVACTSDGRAHSASELAQAEGTPERLHLQIGNLEIRANGKPGQPACAFVYSRIFVDGKPFPVKSIDIHGDVNGVWTVKLEYYPHLLKEK